jgi:hypothetical protein
MHLSRVTIAAAVITLNVASFIALSLWTKPHPVALHGGPESNAISGMLLVSAVVEPVLDAALTSDAFDPSASIEEIAAEVLPEAPPPPPGPPLPAGLAPPRQK